MLRRNGGLLFLGDYGSAYFNGLQVDNVPSKPEINIEH